MEAYKVNVEELKQVDNFSTCILTVQIHMVPYIIIGMTDNVSAMNQLAQQKIWIK